MINCKNCKADCANKRLDRPRESCLGYWGATNADRIRAMSDEELADCFCHMGTCPVDFCPQNENAFMTCKRCWLDWLKSPVEVDHANPD